MEKGRPAQTDKGQRAAESGAGQAQHRMGTEAQEQKPASRTERGQLRTGKQALASALQEKAQTGQAMQPENREGKKAQTGQAARPERAQTGQAVAPETPQGSQIQGGKAARTGQGQPSNATAERPSENALATRNVHTIQRKCIADG
jgi:hypothetical protein